MSRKHTHPCAIAETLNILGDRWSLLIIREAFYGATRFGEFLTNTGISRNLLTERLLQLVDAGLLTRTPYADRGTSYVYDLTDKGRSLDGVMLAIIDWGNRELYGEGREPVRLVDRQSGLALAGVRPVDKDGNLLEPSDLVLELGPGGDGRTRNRLARAKQDIFRASDLKS